MYIYIYIYIKTGEQQTNKITQQKKQTKKTRKPTEETNNHINKKTCKPYNNKKHIKLQKLNKKQQQTITNKLTNNLK